MSVILNGMSMVDDEQRVVLNVDWDGYLKIAEAVGEAPGVRMTYDRGRLEIMNTSGEHERKKTELACLLECLMLERNVDFIGGGNQTFKNKAIDKAFEPDECYWVENWPAVKRMGQWWDPSYPPPDLAIEVEVSRSVIPRIGIYRAMKVPEIWRWTMEEELNVLVLGPDGYVSQERSPTFGDFDPQVLARIHRNSEGLATSQLIRLLREELR